MNSIGNKIQIALIGSICIVAFFALVMLSINQLGALQNQQVIQTMTMEYSIISLSDNLIKSYNDVVKNPGTKEFLSNYQSTHEKLPAVIATLKKRIISQDSKLLLVGVERTVNQVITECDTGLKEVQNNDFLDFSTHFVNANKENDFVKSNTSTLLQKELEYLSGTEKNSEKIYRMSLAFSVGIFVLIVVGMIFFARSFSQQLITPLVKLSLFAKDIANGNFQNQDKKMLKITQDETGSLTQSIYTMVDKLMGMIDNERKASEELKQSGRTIENNNAELQRMNTLMIGRELKMVELKEELEKLKKELHPS